MASPGVIVLSILNALLAFVGTIVNYLVVFVVFKNQDLQTELNLLIASLSSADFIVCLVAQPMYIVVLNKKGGKNFKDVFELTASIALHASFNSLTGITLNRMAVLLHPFSYALSNHRKRLYASILLGIWCSSIALAYFFTTSTGKLIQAYVHAVMFCMFVFSYSCIFWEAGKQVRKISSQMQSVSFNHQAGKLRKESNAAKTSAILVSTTLICFFPDIVVDFMQIVDEVRLSWGFTLLFLSSSLNPCIYVWRNERFRMALWRTVRCLPRLINNASSTRVHPFTVTRSREQNSISYRGNDVTLCSIETLE